MDKKLQVYHFHNGSGGGVLSVIRNLLRFSKNPSIENHVIFTINKDVKPIYTVETLEGSQSEQVFYYSPKWNFYHTCRQLAKLLPDDKAIIVAHDWLELGMASNLGLQNPVVQIVHGNYEYYYDLAISHSLVVDTYIGISNRIFNSLQEKLSSRYNDIFYLNFPVPNIEAVIKKNEPLQLIYYVNNLKDNNKQFTTIVEIATQLSGAPDNYFFTIAGGGITREEFFDIWPVAMRNHVNYKGLQTNEEMIALLPSQHIFLLPSLAEGLPVSLVEAMKAGAVPLITNWDNGAVDELVKEGVTGYSFKMGAALDYVVCIKNLQCNRQWLSQLSDNCIQISNTIFDPVINTKKFEDVYNNIVLKKMNLKNPVKVYGSRLDLSWLGNKFTYLVRNSFKKNARV